MRKKVTTKILMSIMTIVTVGALIGGGVYAAFSDPETSTGNQFTAGTLDLTVDGENPWTSTPVSVGNMKPGDLGVVTLTVYNAGNLSGTLSFDLTNLSDSEGTNTEPEGNTAEPGDLSANMDILIWVDSNGDGIKDVGETVLYIGKLSAEAGPYSIGTLNSGVTNYVSMSYSIDSGVGNDIQGDSSSFDLEFTLAQV